MMVLPHVSADISHIQGGG